MRRTEAGAGSDRGDGRERFERCFRDHYVKILAFALRRVGGREAAEDAVAETFAVAWRRRDRIPEPALPWLYGVALRVISNQRRSDRRHRKLEARLTFEAGVREAAPDSAESLDRRRAFFAAFAELEEREREVLRLVAWEGLETREAATAFGCSPGAFRVRLHRARRKLAKQLEAAGHPIAESRRHASELAEEVK